MRQEITLGLLRIGLGWIFLWAFLDKLFGLGFGTAAEKAWLAGGSPTSGFLLNAAKGPFAGIFSSLAGSAVVDWLFMLGLLGIGLSLILGIGTTIATYSGSLLMLLMWLAVLPPANNPILDDHIIYILALFALHFSHAQDHWGLGQRWGRMGLVQRWPFLR